MFTCSLDKFRAFNSIKFGNKQNGVTFRMNFNLFPAVLWRKPLVMMARIGIFFLYLTKWEKPGKRIGKQPRKPHCGKMFTAPYPPLFCGKIDRTLKIYITKSLDSLILCWFYSTPFVAIYDIYFQHTFILILTSMASIWNLYLGRDDIRVDYCGR